MGLQDHHSRQKRQNRTVLYLCPHDCRMMIKGGVMLRAAPERNGALELIRLTLQLLQQRCENDISTDLKSHFARVVREAKQLTTDPLVAPARVSPESIELALRMSLYTELLESMKYVDGVDTISPELASRLLRTMENHPVYSDQFAFAP